MLNQITTTQLAQLLQGGWVIEQDLGRDANGEVLEIRRLTGPAQQLVEVTDLLPPATQPVSGTLTVQNQVFDPAVLTWESWQAIDQGGGVAVPIVSLGGNSTVGLGPLGLTNVVAMQTANPIGNEGGLVVRLIDALGLADTTGIGASAAAPGAGVNVSGTLTPGTAGVYEVWAYAGTALGVPAAGDEANMALKQTAATVMVLPYTAGTAGQFFGPFRRTLTAINTLHVDAVAAATAGVTYTAGVTARRVA